MHFNDFSLSAGLLVCIAPFVQATEIDFEDQRVGDIPGGWISGVTGNDWISRLTGAGDFHWVIETDTSAPSPDHVLTQSAKGKYPWAVVKDSSLENGFVQARFKTVSGKTDQAAGLIWRWQDGDNYYVARANSLENNVSIYYMKDGRRHTLQYADAGKDNPITTNTWQTLRVEFQGKHITVSLNTVTLLEVDDEQISTRGAVGLWTKADSVTEFDNFMYDPLPAAR